MRWLDAELLDVAVETLGPERRPEAQHDHSMRAGPTQQRRHLVLGEQVANSLGEHARTGRRFPELPIELIEELPDRVGIGDDGLADSQLGRRAHRGRPAP